MINNYAKIIFKNIKLLYNKLKLPNTGYKNNEKVRMSLYI